MAQFGWLQRINPVDEIFAQTLATRGGRGGGRCPSQMLQKKKTHENRIHFEKDRFDVGLL